MTNTVEDYVGELPAGWIGGQAITKWWRGKHVHLYTLHKLCAECGGSMRLDVSRAALEGKAKNAGLHLTRCAACRAKSRALQSSSRPHVEGEPPPRVLKHAFFAADAPHVETADEALRTANATMKEELEGLYTQNRELRERLSKYELAPAMEAMANGAVKPTQKMPWEH